MPDYENFIFYGSWIETLDGLAQKCGDNFAKDVAWQIIKFGTTQEMDTDDPVILGIVNGMCRDLISSAKKRRLSSIENGKQGGRPKRFSDDEILTLSEQGLAAREIADQLGCSIKTVQRALMSDDEI